MSGAEGTMISRQAHVLPSLSLERRPWLVGDSSNDVDEAIWLDARKEARSNRLARRHGLSA